MGREDYAIEYSTKQLFKTMSSQTQTIDNSTELETDIDKPFKETDSLCANSDDDKETVSPTKQTAENEEEQTCEGDNGTEPEEISTGDFSKLALDSGTSSNDLTGVNDDMIGHAKDDCFLCNGEDSKSLSEDGDLTRVRSEGEAAILKLQDELNKSKEILKLRDVEVEKLSKIRDEVGAELEELTASLFEEAHKMVREANVKRANAEKKENEANLKIEVLVAEVEALKALVLTSTPSSPNHLVNSQSSPSPDRKFPPQSPAKAVANGHKRASSHGGVSNSSITSPFSSSGRSSFGAGGTASSPSTFNSPNVPLPHPCPKNSNSSDNSSILKRELIDPVAFSEFSTWIENPVLDRDAPFLARIFAEDIQPCFTFSNKQLSTSILSAIEANSIVIEPLNSLNVALPRSSSAYGGRICALSQLSKMCNYKVRLENCDVGDGDPPWHFISDFCRNRIIAVCEFYTYVRYIVQGLVKRKSDAHETFAHIQRLRRNMALARLGFELLDL